MTTVNTLTDFRGIRTDCTSHLGRCKARSQGFVAKNLTFHAVPKKVLYIPRRILRRIGVVAASMVSVLLLACFLNPSDGEQTTLDIAGTGPKTVYGHVYDSALTPVPGADVTVRIKYGSNERKNMSTSTDLSGFYTVTFGQYEWELDDTIQVDVTYGSLTATNSTIATSLPFQVVDVHFAELIPEFGAFFIVLTIAVPLLVAASYRRSRRNAAQD